MEVQISSMEAMWNKHSTDKKLGIENRKVDKLVKVHNNKL